MSTRRIRSQCSRTTRSSSLTNSIVSSATSQPKKERGFPRGDISTPLFCDICIVDRVFPSAYRILRVRGIQTSYESNNGVVNRKVSQSLQPVKIPSIELGSFSLGIEILWLANGCENIEVAMVRVKSKSKKTIG
ncbi:hypothetical protein PIB30_098187 [Stylosanthes scabra]|uniref:Uncharacterized protein n=1 Tax=Stylosanthes scabra TaxID=79078 RepID=A0ABU6UVE7_9FABA|nr:hypothetical protein [Stylosanthes scabra]